MVKTLVGLVAGASLATFFTPVDANAEIRARFEYGCQPRASSYSELTCTFDGSSSVSSDGVIQGYRWYFRRYSPEDRESESATRTGVRVTHTYTVARARHYTYYAALEVTDSLGNRHTHTEQVDPGRRMEFPPANQKPLAEFTVSCTFLDCVFDASRSSDPDGFIASYTWNFGDNSSGSGNPVPHTYLVPGAYIVSLTVADNAGATTVAAKSISVSSPQPPPPAGFILTATGTRANGGRHVGMLSWTGATSSHVDVFRNGTFIARVSNTGKHSDPIGTVGRGTYTYTVCEAGTTICSNQASIAFD